MDEFERTLKLLDECIEIVSKMNNSLRNEIIELENEITLIQAEKIVRNK